tara:strand:+ start:528 stop:803 length:276 start_codon:yes stop_codon:yes gene_type:complete
MWGFKMKFLKLSLLLLPLFVLADNPILPDDIDTGKENSTQAYDQSIAESKSVEVDKNKTEQTDTEVKITKSDLNQENDLVLTLFLLTMIAL